MTYAEVVRLRGLRNVALRTRALAEVLDSSNESGGNTVFARSALACWRVVRIISGTLHAHPFLPYQQGPSEMRAAWDHLSTKLLAGAARYKDRQFDVFSVELRRVARELDDVRALTWLSDLSDSLGRSQLQIRRLIQEVESDEQFAGSNDFIALPRVEVLTAVRSDARGNGAAGNWPYLAF
jgi:hypothetical protein